MFAVILNEARSFLRNGSSLFFCIFFPSILVFFLGTFLESVEVSDAVVGELSIAYSTQNADSVSAISFEKFINSLESGDVLSAEKISADEISEAVSDKYSAAVELNGSDIIIHGGSNVIKNRTVKALFDSYNQTAKAYMTAASVNPAALSSIETASDSSFAKQKDLGTNRSMMDYYAVAMAVMIVFMGSCIGGATTYSNEHNNRTIDRLNISPVSPTAVFFGKIIGSMPMVIIQVVTVMIVSTVFYGAHYCSSFGGNLLLAVMLVSVSLAVLAVGILVNLFFPKLTSMPIIMLILWVMMFYSGTFAMDIHIDGISERLPAYIVQKAAFDLTVFSRPERAVHTAIAALIIFAVLLVIGAIKVNVRRKKA